MIASGWLASAGHVERVRRRQRAIATDGGAGAEHTALAQAAGFTAVMAMRVAVPAFVVYAAWLKARVTSDVAAVRWGAAAAFGVVLASGHLFQATALSFTAREVLFLPDRASVLLARCLRSLPLHLGIGVAWSAAVWLSLREAWPRQPAAVAAICGVAMLAPLARNVALLLQRLAAPEAGSVLAPACLVALATVYCVGSAQWTGDLDRIALSWTVLCLSLLPLLALLHGLNRALRAPLRQAWVDLLRVPRALVIVALVVPPAAWGDSPWLPIAAVAGAAIIVLLPAALRAALHAVNHAEAETRNAAIELATDHDAPREARAPRAMPMVPHRGRSPWRATWRLHWLLHGITRRDLIRPSAVIPFLWRHGAGIAFAALLGLVGGARPLPVAFFFVVFAMPWGCCAPRERLHRLGFDLRAQLRHEAALVLWIGALPALCMVALVATLAHGWNSTTVMLIALLAAGFIMRVGWRGLMPRPESARPVAGFLLGALLLVATIASSRRWPALRNDIDPAFLQHLIATGNVDLAYDETILQWPIVAIVAAIGLLGLVRRVAKWREPALLEDLIAARERATTS